MQLLSKLLALSFLMAGSGFAQDPFPPPPGQRPSEDHDIRLPNGKSQRDAMLKEDFQKTLKDTDQLVALSKELKEELEKSGTFVVSVGAIKKTEEIEKLSKKIRGRLKR